MGKQISVLLLAISIVGCGMQNTSVLTQQFKVSQVPFAEIKKSAILLEPTNRWQGQAILIDTLKGLTIDAVTGGISADSLNRLCFQELRSQLTTRFPELKIVDQSTISSTQEVGYEFRLDSVEIIFRNEQKVMISLSGVDKATISMRVNAFDRRNNNLPLFSVQSRSEVLMINYKNPWQKAAQLNATRIADYLDSNGDDYAK